MFKSRFVSTRMFLIKICVCFAAHTLMFVELSDCDLIKNSTEQAPRMSLLRLSIRIYAYHGVTKRCRPSWLTNGALVYEPKCGGKGEVARSQPMSTAVHRSPNKLWRSNFIFNL